MAGIKLNIGRSKSRQIAPQNDRPKSQSPTSKPNDTKKKLLNCDFTKSMFKASREGQASKLLKSNNTSQMHQECNVSDTDATDRTVSSEFTLEHGLLADCDARRNCINTGTASTATKELDGISEAAPTRQPSREHRHSWICSSWDCDGSFCGTDDGFEEELDDSLYQLLDVTDESNSPKEFKKLSLHNILVEEELSFQKSLVWNDEER